jgi:DNA-binding GntR family transcriptional regulator
MMEPIANGSMRSRLTDWLFDAILRGDLVPGARIVEGKLARRLGVAQTTLREALQELEHQGLLTKSERRGNFVVKLTVKDMEDIYVVRRELEPIAAALAHQRMTAKDYQELTRIMEDMRVAGTRKEYIQVLKLDMLFHQTIWRFSGNHAVERALNAVCPPVFANYMVRISHGEMDDFGTIYDLEKDYEEHDALVAALKKGGPEEVRQAFREMLETFGVQDVGYLRLAESKQSGLAGKKGHKRACAGPAS